MRTRELEAFLELPTIRDAGARRATFRQTIATLARVGTTFGPSPPTETANRDRQQRPPTETALAHAEAVANPSA